MFLCNTFGPLMDLFYLCGRFKDKYRTKYLTNRIVKMQKRFLGIMAALTLSAHAFAGGYLTNTNQNAAFGRNLSQEAMIDIMATYANPAGVGFLRPGWHMAFTNQTAFQTRTIESSYGAGLFDNGIVNGENNSEGGKKYKGVARAPFLPSLDFAYVQDRWSVALHFGVTGGGGKCEFEDGLGSFESQVALLPVLANALSPNSVAGYSMDTYMKGRQYYFGTQVMGSYKVLPNLNIAAGVRMVNASCAYEGHVKNIGVMANTPAGVVPMKAADFLTAAGYGSMAGLVADRELDCTQSGIGFTPIVGIDWRINDQWNVAAKYEFGTRLTLKNSTATNADGAELNAGIASYSDGVEQRADLPAILYLGAQYSPIPSVRINVGGHVYFDKQATQHLDRHEKLDGPGWEILAGAEYDINDLVTVSAGWQNTNYGLGDNSEFISDLSFVTNSNSVGLGARFHVSKKVAIDVSYFKTFYTHYKREQADYNHNWETMSQRLQPVISTMKSNGESLAAGIKTLATALADPTLPAAQRTAYTTQLNTYKAQLQALSDTNDRINDISTQVYGSDNFTRTNDVFAVGVSLSF